MDRKNRIGGSDVAALFGLDPYKSYWRLWHEKAGNIEPEDVSQKDEVKFGVKMERAIAVWFSEENKLEYHYTDYIGSKNINNFGGKPDFYIEKTPLENNLNMGVLEVKTTGYNSYKLWVNGEPPIHYQLQLQTYMGLSGMKWGMLAILVDRKLLPPFEYEFRPKVFSAIEQKVVEFWQSIKEGREPEQKYDDRSVQLIRKELVDDAVDLGADQELDKLLKTYKTLDFACKNFDPTYKDRDLLKKQISNYLFSKRINSNNVICNGVQLITKTCPDVVVKEHTRKGGQKLIIKLNGEENE